MPGLPSAPQFNNGPERADAALSRLPHPVRWSKIPDVQAFLETFSKNFPQAESLIRTQMSDESIVLREAIRRLTRGPQVPGMGAYLTAIRSGGASAFYQHQVRPMPIFALDDDLVGLLEHMDISEDVPVSSVKLPYPRFYIHLGMQRSCSLTLPDTQGIAHVFEGAYIQQGVYDGNEVLYLELTGAPLNRTDQDVAHVYQLPLVEPSKSVLGLVESHKRGFINAVVTREQAWDAVRPAVLLLLKALFYIGMPGVRRELRAEHTQALKVAAGLNSSAKRAKALRRAERTYDYTLICVQPEHRAIAQGLGGGTGRRSHWRRGHWRMQAHGEHWAQRRLIFIQPMLIGPGSDAAAPSSYRVK